MVKVGDKAPDFTLLDQDGNEFSLSESLKANKVWHLVFFGTPVSVGLPGYVATSGMVERPQRPPWMLGYGICVTT
jgi:hypothetical protein